MFEIIYFKARKSNKISCVANIKNMFFSIGDKIIVQKDNFTSFCTVIDIKKNVDNKNFDSHTRVLRKANRIDFGKLKKIVSLESNAARFFKKEVSNLNLKMSLVSVENSFDMQKLNFSYTADERVDFRNLLKRLAAKFKTRIELHQLSAREKTALVGGLGVCGREFCCKTFLNYPQNVTMKLALDQKLQLEASKLSGTCGKLKCCLKYEKEVYSNLISEMPKIGSLIGTKDGVAQVVELFPIAGKIKILSKNGNEDTTSLINLNEVLY